MYAKSEYGPTSQLEYAQGNPGELAASHRAARERESTQRESAGATPPLLIGGVIHPESEQEPDDHLTGVGVDYLSLTAPIRVAEQLMDDTRLLEEGNSPTGFGKSQLRECIGGKCWRKYEPVSKSKRWGTDYESWEFSGDSATQPARKYLGAEVRPSRLDIAFDYQCGSGFYPSSLEPHFIKHCQDNKIKIEYQGGMLEHTTYAGSQKSDRRVRIYRRDLKDGNYFEPGMHILRVELVLRGDMLDAYWSKCSETGEHDYGIAASHVYKLIGLAPAAKLTGIPPLIQSDEEQEGVQMLLQFVKQHHSTLQACAVAGIDLAALSAVPFENETRVQRSRLSQRVEALTMLPAKEIMARVAALLRPHAV